MFWEILFAGLIVAGLMLFGLQATLKEHRQKTDSNLRIALADYRVFLRGESYVREVREKVEGQVDDGGIDYFEGEKIISGIYCQERQRFTGEDLSEQIASMEEIQEKRRMRNKEEVMAESGRIEE